MALLLMFGVFLNLFVSLPLGPNLKERFLKTVLVFLLLLWSLTELFSKFQRLDYCIWGWVMLLIIPLSIAIKKNNNSLYFRYLTKKKLYRSSILWLSLTSIVLGILLLQGVLYPPNNWDSMTYHLGRIPHWLSHQSVAFYPTHIIRQIYQPPMAEYVILHIVLLTGHDYWVNAVQLSFLLFSVIALLSVAAFVEKKRLSLWWLVTLALTIPEVLLQATSTQNDIILSFFVLSGIYFAYRCYTGSQWSNYLFLGLSVGFGFLTKGTAVIFFAPLLGILGVALVQKLYRAQTDGIFIRQAAIAALVVLGLNLPHYARIYSLKGNVIQKVQKGVSKGYANETMNGAWLMSNLVKNASLHLGPYPLNQIAEKTVRKLHNLTGLNADNPQTNYLGLTYTAAPDLPIHEDFAPNTLHFGLILLALCVGIVRGKQSPKLSLFAVLILLQALLFCLFLKWQPWHTRLHTPLFIEGSLLIYMVAQQHQIVAKILRFITPFLVLTALFVVTFNQLRPFVKTSFTYPIAPNDERFKKYFAHQIHLYPEYAQVVAYLATLGRSQYVGLMVGSNDWEYPFFAPFLRHSLHPVNVDVQNVTKNIAMPYRPLRCIVSTVHNRPFIIYRGRTFRNLTPLHRFVWLYIPN